MLVILATWEAEAAGLKAYLSSKVSLPKLQNEFKDTLGNLKRKTKQMREMT